MSDIGMIPVDWEVRFDPQRMLRERLQRAKDALNNSDLDALFVFRTEDARYLTGYRHHLGPAFIMGNAVTVLSRKHDPILWTMDFEHCKLRMPWLCAGSDTPAREFPRKNRDETLGRAGRRPGRFARRQASRHRHLGYQHGGGDPRSVPQDRHSPTAIRAC